jgi:hypothetical protein
MKVDQPITVKIERIAHALAPTSHVLLRTDFRRCYPPAMNWDLNDLTAKQERAIRENGYVGLFLSVFMPRLMAEEPPKTEPAPPPAPDAPVNKYVPLAHRDSSGSSGDTNIGTG